MPNDDHFLFDRVAVIGVGLIGGSIGKGLLSRNLARTVVGIGRNAERLMRAIDFGTISEFTTRLNDGVADADIVVVCTPVHSIVDFVVAAAKSAPSETLITDGGSTKRQIVEEVHRRLDHDHCFVGSHPLAGGEKTGAEFADADLFEERLVIVTPVATTNAVQLGRCQIFWESLGASVKSMSPGEHDAVVSSISHLPHVIAALLSSATPEKHIPFASTGWSDTTRVAAGDIEMWSQIIQQNKSQLQNSLSEFGCLLEQFNRALAADDFATVCQLLEQGKNKRDAVAN
jgi:prephenate dehydrogenase